MAGKNRGDPMIRAGRKVTANRRAASGKSEGQCARRIFEKLAINRHCYYLRAIRLQEA